MLEGQVFGISGDHIDLLSDQSGSALPAGKKALELPGSDLIAAAVSPWREVFLSDSGKKTLQRIVYRNGNLVSNGLLSEPHLTSPRRLEFSPEGELFVANANDGHHGVLRFRFVLEDFVDWTAEPRGSIDLGEVGALGLTLAKPVGFVVSEKTLPLEKVKGHGTHFGVSEGVIAFLQDLPGENFAENSERASASVVEYEPGGHTYVHFHPDMEQMEIVIGGRALWEVGEVEKEVGPGDVIFTPRYVKHGYKVLGDVPFRFYQVEWRGIKD
jgi:quercetin dioxygenase-like cupin family protein